MERWVGRVALVTGANSGIGACISESLVKAGMKVVGADLNVDAMEKFKQGTSSNNKGSLTPVKCDLTVEKEVNDLFKLIKEDFRGVDVCVNSAGLDQYNSLLDGSPSEWTPIAMINIVALCHCSKMAAASMIERGITDGQIINMGSLFGHITKVHPTSHFYTATKHAVKFLTEGFRQEMMERNHKIRVASISPGPVKTNMTAHRPKETSFELNPHLPVMVPQDIANEVLHILSLPPQVEINDILIRPRGNEF